tara:strand:+ start:162 stop:992 length:831 start_codon:yes stop_codon:yes gene_type:complete
LVGDQLVDPLEIIKNQYNTTYLEDAQIDNLEDKNFFKQHMLEGYEKLQSLNNKYHNEPALIMGLGPSLFETNQASHRDDIKFTCNHFHMVPDFFDKDMKPDYWCAANSYDELKDPFQFCMKKNIKSIVTIPIRKEFVKLLKMSKTKLVYPWMWEQKIFQIALAQKYGIKKAYSHCNTITNHMIAYALWMGCNPINVTGFDLSHNQALETYGSTHAGFTDSRVKTDKSIHGSAALDNPAMRKQIMADLKYLCFIANKNNIKINNMSYRSNKLPETLS